MDKNKNLLGANELNVVTSLEQPLKDEGMQEKILETNPFEEIWKLLLLLKKNVIEIQEGLKLGENNKEQLTEMQKSYQEAQENLLKKIYEIFKEKNRDEIEKLLTAAGIHKNTKLLIDGKKKSITAILNIYELQYKLFIKEKLKPEIKITKEEEKKIMNKFNTDTEIAIKMSEITLTEIQDKINAYQEIIKIYKGEKYKDIQEIKKEIYEIQEVIRYLEGDQKKLEASEKLEVGDKLKVILESNEKGANKKYPFKITSKTLIKLSDPNPNKNKRIITKIILIAGNGQAGDSVNIKITQANPDDRFYLAEIISKEPEPGTSEALKKEKAIEEIIEVMQVIKNNNLLIGELEGNIRREIQRKEISMKISFSEDEKDKIVKSILSFFQKTPEIPEKNLVNFLIKKFPNEAIIKNFFNEMGNNAFIQHPFIIDFSIIDNTKNFPKVYIKETNSYTISFTINDIPVSVYGIPENFHFNNELCAVSGFQVKKDEQGESFLSGGYNPLIEGVTEEKIDIELTNNATLSHKDAVMKIFKKLLEEQKKKPETQPEKKITKMTEFDIIKKIQKTIEMLENTSEEIQNKIKKHQELLDYFKSLDQKIDTDAQGMITKINTEIERLEKLKETQPKEEALEETLEEIIQRNKGIIEKDIKELLEFKITKDTTSEVIEEILKDIHIRIDNLQLYLKDWKNIIKEMTGKNITDASEMINWIEKKIKGLREKEIEVSQKIEQLKFREKMKARGVI